MIGADFHLHTVHSDGENAPEEMVLTAIERGFTALGFSDHAYVETQDYCMKADGAEAYRQEILALKEKYRGKIDIFCGIEQDYYSEEPTDGYDYVIGSVHEIHRDGQVVDIDDTLPIFEQSIAAYGDAYALAEAYFGLVAKLPFCDIIGHLDLLTKFQQQKPLLDEAHPRYRDAAAQAVRALLPMGSPFEVNVGAMNRGIRTTPYPASWLLQYIRERGGEVTLSGDCHNAESLGRHFDTALAAIRAAGFERVVTFTANGKEYIKI